jgi:hypothetical protein
MAGLNDKNEAFFSKGKAVVANAYACGTVGGELAAMMREMIKDLRNTQHEVFFGQPERSGEPGAPLNPTQGEITADRQREASTPSGIARGSVHGPAMEKGGQVLHQEQKSWEDRIKEERKGKQDGNEGSDQNERARGRSLPDEQRENQRDEQERGGRGR